MTRKTTVTINTMGIVPGMEIATSDGRRYTVVGVHQTYIGIRRSTWWRRLYWRLRNWRFRRRFG